MIDVFVFLKRGKDQNWWIVAKCPICFRRHSHGAGEPGEDPLENLGSRVPHCGAANKPRGTFYRLCAIEAPFEEIRHG